jgi:hypothetical protein
MIDLTTILKDAPEGTTLYSPIFGDITFVELIEPKSEDDYAIKTKFGKLTIYFTKHGKYNRYGECMLFPSSENRSWENVSYKPKREDLLQLTPVVTFTQHPKYLQELVILPYCKDGRCFIDNNEKTIPTIHAIPVDKFDFVNLTWNEEDDYGYRTDGEEIDVMKLFKEFFN